MKLYMVFNKVIGEFDAITEMINDTIAVRNFAIFISNLKKQISEGKAPGCQTSDFELYRVGEYEGKTRDTMIIKPYSPVFIADENTVNSQDESIDNSQEVK